MEKSGSRSFTLSWWPFVLAFLVLCFCGETCNAKDDSKSSCTSSCGPIHNITYPFRLNDDPKKCGDRMYTLSCEHNNTTVLDLLDSGKYYVQAINYKNKTIRLLDPGLDNNNCSSLPQNWLSSDFPYPYGSPLSTSTSVFYLMCRNPVNSSLYVDTAPCLNNSATSLIQPKSYSYVMVDRQSYLDMEDLNEGCSVERMAWMLLDYSKGYNNASYSYEYIHSALMYGFELRVVWPDEIFTHCNGTYYVWTPTQSKCFPRTIPDPYDSQNRRGSPLSTSVYYLRCRNQVNSSLYVDTAPCLNNSATSLIQPKSYSYVMVHRPSYLDMEDWNEGCSVERMAWMLLDYNASYSYEYIHSALMYGFEIQVYWPDERRSICNGSYYIYGSTHLKCFPRTIPGA